ncbi:hypothetical protein [Flavisolibacter tropicus]|uniref:Uncharacterized protein n=1 Tax=Flavisolibacter tropicus TaxID=1492898 RepID=A0A172TYQ6_9BACT|nr:hypothetical protein [Flavisolibacter tropicus]ANE52122.1 hypothetical protein SY85_18105 [Flavisolibacter tropicus]
MRFYLDEENSNKNYSYATFEESIGGKPFFINKREISLIIPVINQGVYDLKTFNNGSQTPIYFDKSYYFFKDISEYFETLFIREDSIIKGEFNNKFKRGSQPDNQKSFYIELERGYNGSFFYGARWSVSASEFGVVIPESSRHSEDEQLFFKQFNTLSSDDLDFLLNNNQVELENFVKQLP